MNNVLVLSRVDDRVMLPKTLELQTAALLATDFLSLRGEALTLDASQVQKIGAQCMQVIVSAYLTWERDGVSITLTNPSPVFSEAMTIGGWNMDRFGQRENA